MVLIMPSRSLSYDVDAEQQAAELRANSRK